MISFDYNAQKHEMDGNFVIDTIIHQWEFQNPFGLFLSRIHHWGFLEKKLIYISALLISRRFSQINSLAECINSLTRSARLIYSWDRGFFFCWLYILYNLCITQVNGVGPFSKMWLKKMTKNSWNSKRKLFLVNCLVNSFRFPNELTTSWISCLVPK